MRDIRDINAEIEDVFQVAMAPALYLPNTFFIFRSLVEQIVITVDGNSFISSLFLTTEELNHIEKNYPFLDTINYKVKSR